MLVHRWRYNGKCSVSSWSSQYSQEFTCILVCSQIVRLMCESVRKVRSVQSNDERWMIFGGKGSWRNVSEYRVVFVSDSVRQFFQKQDHITELKQWVLTVTSKTGDKASTWHFFPWPLAFFYSRSTHTAFKGTAHAARHGLSFAPLFVFTQSLS